MSGQIFSQIAPGRFSFRWRTPWGQDVPAEILVSTRRGWPHRDEASDPRWAAFEVGPAIVAIRLMGESFAVASSSDCPELAVFEASLEESRV
jgi:hypothetical protein